MKKTYKSLLSMLFIFGLNISSAKALMINPNRIELSDKSKSAEVQLVNNSDNIVTYRISLQHLRMDQNGAYTAIGDDEVNTKERFADDFIVFSPKGITLAPKEIQSVRVALKRSGNLAKGEYRSHLLFREEPPADFQKSTNVEANNSKNKKISVTLKPIFGVSIPVIVRSGDLSATVNIANIAVKTDSKLKGKKFLSFSILRDGESSVYGDVSVFLKDGGQEYQIGSLNNLSVFYPYPRRDVRLELNMPKGVNLSPNSLITVKYNDKSDSKNLLATSLLSFK